jgi:glycerol-3-phosphate dehydrogenase
MYSVSTPAVLILGAGINGAAIARELTLNGLGVVVVDRGDISSGATAYSSRLIHGGLRYLEYAEFGLVRESLAERTRLLELAPHFVKPLRLFIPVTSRWGGMLSAPRRFFGLRAPPGDIPKPRGLWLVRMGLGLYDLLASGSSLPARGVHRVGSGDTPPFNANKHPWACSYWDAQITYPERFTLAMLEDARRLAERHGVEFRVLTYHEAELIGRVAKIRPAAKLPGQVHQGEVAHEFQPAAVINATGAWVDGTLRSLHIASPRLMGGTKGSHLVTHHAGLREALAGRGVYAEAADGRPVFLLPFGEATLIGTTDLPFEQSAETAVASEAEVEYLLQAASDVFPQLGLSRDDVSLHYSGVRPLPYVGATTPAAITRRHFLKEHPEAAVPLFSVIGGKLTTCRSLAEQAAETLLPRLNIERRADSRQRPLPGEASPAENARGAAIAGYTAEQMEAVQRLCGGLSETVLELTGPSQAGDRESLSGTNLPLRFVRYSLRHEWPSRLADLVERRFLLHFHEPLTEACLRRLAEAMVEEQLLAPEHLEAEVAECRRRLVERYAKKIVA